MKDELKKRVVSMLRRLLENHVWRNIHHGGGWYAFDPDNNKTDLQKETESLLKELENGRPPANACPLDRHFLATFACLPWIYRPSWEYWDTSWWHNPPIYKPTTEES